MTIMILTRAGIFRQIKQGFGRSVGDYSVYYFRDVYFTRRVLDTFLNGDMSAILLSELRLPAVFGVRYLSQEVNSILGVKLYQHYMLPTILVHVQAAVEIRLE